MTRYTAWIISSGLFVAGVSTMAATMADAAPRTLNQVAVRESQPAGTSDVELIRERYPNRAVKIEREVIRDADDNYIDHGSWKMWDPRGNVIAEGHYRDGKRQGTWTGWYLKNEVQLVREMPYKEFPGPYVSRATFDRGRLHGKWTIFDSKHRKISEWEYVDGKRHGKRIFWYLNGRKMREANFEHGVLHGEVIELSPTGKVTRKETYFHGRRKAMKVEYYPNEQKKVEGEHLFARRLVDGTDEWWRAKLAPLKSVGEDVRSGQWKIWYASGQLRRKGRYEANVLVGEFTWWYPNGQKSVVGNYENGQKDGDWIWYHQNGQKSIQGEFVMGGPHGEWVWWHASGKVSQKVEYSPGGEAVVADRNDGTVSEERSVVEYDDKDDDLVPQSATAPRPLKFKR